ncbi:MAG: N-6 DNA methylase [Acidobacteria bacterium]|nr:N-6 DNA methylase [Acidobacteriota bacterium]
MQDSDANLAVRLTRLAVRAVDEAFLHQELGNPYDVLNEAFGHFIRDNFRGNIEDAQYLTPAEVVELMATMAVEDLQRDGRLSDRQPVVVADPCCGVGSFLATFAARYRAARSQGAPSVRLYGQDKVERMVRLATVNRGPLESELLFVDRDLTLLREGGLLLIVVPDSVISASGVAALLRHHLRTTATLRGVIELPSVTFAQAGTRTKTAILYLQKGRTTVNRRHRIFMGVSSGLGFQVNSRKGVQIKVEKGENDLPALLNAYRKMHEDSTAGEAAILSEAPSAVAIPDGSIRDAWTAGHYQARRLEVLRNMAEAPDVLTVQLKDLVDFVADERRFEQHRPGVAFISVLHVIAEGVLDLEAIMSYAPKTPGVPVKPGEVLLSRINPRIPRALVVPDLGQPILCSSEFEVMRPKQSVEPYLIAYLLLSHAVQAQIQSLTSGTSAPHNRVKTRDLAQVWLPVPRAGSESAKRLKRKVAQYQKVLASMMESNHSLVNLRETEMDWLHT